MNRLFFVLLFAFPLFVNAQNSDDILRKVSNNIENINNVSYRLISFGGEPDDSLFTNNSDSYEFYTKNEKDSIVKARYYYTKNNEPDKVSLIYDGVLKHINWTDKKIKLDSLNSPVIAKLPYYPVLAPLFIRIKSVIDYAVSNPSNSKITTINYGDSIITKINFPNHVIEFMNMQPWIVQCPNIEPKDIHSSYTVWINKRNLPYKFLREVRTERCLDYIKEFEIKDYTSKGILPNIYIPEDFKYVNNNDQVIDNSISMEFGTAPSFTLFDPIDKVNYSSSAMYREKVTLLIFTGIGCGHCKEAIPFLNELKNKYKSLAVVGVETFVTNPEFIKNYIKSNKIQYDYLVANKEIKEAYNISGVPRFYLIDTNRKIVKVVNGYKKEYTNELIFNEIAKLLK